MFSRLRPQTKRASFSSGSNPVSPVQASFDFHLTPSAIDPVPLSPFSPNSEAEISRPRTSHGVAAEGTNTAGLQLLPPIPRVASRQSSVHSMEETDGEGGGAERGREDGDEVSMTSQRLSFEHPVQPVPLLSTPTTPSRAGNTPERAGSSESATPEMTSSLFPPRRPLPVSAAPSAPSPSQIMDRSFIDSRDRPYQTQRQRPLLMQQQNHSSPNLTRTASPAFNPRQPTHVYSSSRNWTSPQASLQNLSSRSTDVVGSTARPSTHASASYTAGLPSSMATIGTPYQSTADSFPLPELVRTRPKTPGGSTATVAGISIPTHHTSATTRMPEKPSEPPRKKGRLRNTLALLQRRRNSQDPELVVEERAVRQAQAQALVRQRDVVASGVNKPPPDFDPRIKGKVVHDFSVPRGKRNTFDEMDLPLPPGGIQSMNTVPSLSSGAYPPRTASLVNRGPYHMPGNEQRKSVHTPVFVEHLSEHPEASRRISSIQAEHLENKDFLQRVSKQSSATNYSQESAALPPFARRSQTLDATQASFYQDDDARRSSNPSSEKERDSTLGSNSEVSPITARSSSRNLEVRASFSPVSPSSPGKASRPLSEGSMALSLLRPVSETSRSSTPDDSARPVSQLSQSSSQWNHRKTSSEVTAKPYSVILAPPAINTIAEGSAESSPIEPSLSVPQDPVIITRGISIRASRIPGPTPDSLQAPRSHADESSMGSTVIQSLLDSTTEMSTPERTPEPEPVNSIQFKPNKDQPKLVEKRTSAAGHSRKNSNAPKHHGSNASRFSFQFASESAAQEQALEEKHRKKQSGEIAQSIPRGRSPDDDDDDDFFDEDAMDDMDEMEMQAVQEEQSDDHLGVPTQSSLYLQQARQALQQHDSDEGSVYDEDDIPNVTSEEDVPYPDHPAFRTHSALGNYSKHNSYMHGGNDGYWRGSTIDHYMRDSYCAPGQSRIESQASGFNFDFSESHQEQLQPRMEGLPSIPQSSRPRSNLHLQPILAVDTQYAKTERPLIPARDNGNSERHLAVGGMPFGSASTEGVPAPAKSERGHIADGTRFSTISDQGKSPNKAPAGPTGIQNQLSPFSAMGRNGPISGTGSADLTALASQSSGPSLIEATTESAQVDDEASDDAAGTVVRSLQPVTEGQQRYTAGIISLASPKKSIHSLQEHGSLDVTGPYGEDLGKAPPALPSYAVTETDKPSDELAHTAKPDSTARKVMNTPSKDVDTIQQEGPWNIPGPQSMGSIPRTLPTARGMSMFDAFKFDDEPAPLPETSRQADNRNTTSSLSGTSKTKSSFNHTRFHSAQQPPSDAPSKHQRFLSDNVARPVYTAPGMSSLGGSEFDEGLSSAPSSRPETASSHQAGLGALGRSLNRSQAVPRASLSGLQKHGSSALDSPPKDTMATTVHVSSPSNANQATFHHHSAAPVSLAPVQEAMQSNLQYSRQGIPYSDLDDEDMYFDDGNFDQDINDLQSGSIDEDVFDDDGFLARPGMMKAVNHRRDNSVMTYASIESGGPYPAFATPNGARGSQRLSQMMLEDLPMQAPVDPRYIPQRNPSEDMKRLGLSDRVPPVPVPANNKEAFTRMQANLQSYHAALAEAANKAAADGRFVRAPSVSTTRSVSSRLKAQDEKTEQLQDNRSINDDRSIYSTDEAGRVLTLKPNGDTDNLAVGRSDTAASHLSHLTSYSPQKMGFDFGFDVPSDNDDDLFGGDDDLVAAANAEALASDDEGFYGQEFDFYGRPRANSAELQAINGGFFGQDGDDGLQRNKSSKEPNLTPITERSEFSTRNSFIAGQFGPASAGPYGPQSPALARMPVLPLHENDVTSFDDLRRLKANAFGDNTSLRSTSNRSSAHSLQATFSPTVNTRPGYFSGGAPAMQFGYSTDSSGSSNPNVPQAGYPHSFQDSPKSAGSSAGLPFSMDVDATPKKNSGHSPMAEPTTARKIPPSQATNGHQSFQSHSRTGSGADSIGYVQEPDPENHGKPRWVLERRRMSDQGQIELIGREVVHSGWI